MNTPPVDDAAFSDSQAAPVRPVTGVSAQASASPAIISSQLLGGKPCVSIDHEGVRYILRATRGGKLILTK